MSSDANHPDFVQTSQVQGSVPNKAALIWDTSRRCRSPQLTHTSDELAAESKGSHAEVQ